jgi:hypothetical protein
MEKKFMKSEEKNMLKKPKKLSISIVLYTAASVIALIGVALLVNNILLFRTTVNGYVSQGYTAAAVLKQLIPSQLLPGIFEPVAVYGGIAFVLIGVGIANKKVSQCLMLLNKEDACSDVIEENIIEQNVTDTENTEAMEQTETV